MPSTAGRSSERTAELGDVIVSATAASRLTFHFSPVLSSACDFGYGSYFDLVQNSDATATSTATASRG